MTTDHDHGPHARARAHAHGHSPGHHDGATDWDAMAAHLEREGEIQLPSLRTAAGWLRELVDGKQERAGDHGPGVRRVLDVGSGPGVAACLLAEVFPEAEVVAVDGSSFLLERARQRAAEAGLTDGRFQVLEAELPADFDALGSADLIWTSRAVHHLGDQQDALNRLAGALRAGGLLAVAEGGLPLRCLPRDIGFGRPGLAARLEAVTEEWFAEMRAELPQATRTAEDWPAMLERAGLTRTGSRTFLTDRPAPLDQRARDHLHARLSRARDLFADRLADDDLRTLDVLLDDGASASIRHRPDAFWLAATTVHTARALRAC